MNELPEEGADGGGGDVVSSVALTSRRQCTSARPDRIYQTVICRKDGDQKGNPDVKDFKEMSFGVVVNGFPLHCTHQRARGG